MAVFGVVAVGGICGCGSTQEADYDAIAEESGGVFRPSPEQERAGERNGGISRDRAWRIVLRRVPPGTDPAAAVSQVESATGLRPEVVDRDGTRVLVYGRYEGPSDPAAQRDLQRIKESTVGGIPVFQGALLLPPSDEGLGGSNPEWDLRRVAGRFGDDAVYTLQIAVYGRNDGSTPTDRELAEFQRAAEQAVATLRDEGEQAFYYHGQFRSTVTVGVFGDDDYDGTVLPPLESRRLREARQRHPYNLLNGTGIRETIRTGSGSTTRLQASVLVAIPKR